MEIIQNSPGSGDAPDDTARARSASDNKQLLITKISPAVKNENRVNVFVNDRFSFSLDIAQVVDFRLKVGQQLSPSRLEELRHASEFGKLYQTTLEKALSRPHSVKEIRDYLVQKRARRIAENRIIENRIATNRTAENRIVENHIATNRTTENHIAENYLVKNSVAPNRHSKRSFRAKKAVIYTDEDINAIISRLQERGYLDDIKFAKFYVENRHLKKGVSIKRLQQDLYAKGIDPSIITEVLSSSSRNDAEEIKKIIAKKSKHYDSDKLIAYLVRQGFDYQLSKDLVLGTD